MKDIESRHKLSLYRDNSVHLERFPRDLLRIFGSGVTLNMSNIKGSSKSCLPGLPTFKSWEDTQPKKGMRDLIKRKMINIKSQIRSNI